eukprot:gene53345-61039_t
MSMLFPGWPRSWKVDCLTQSLAKGSVLGLTCAPTGNAWPTGTALNVQGTTKAADNREFLVNLGLTSNTGAKSRPTPYHDKVTLYTGIVAEPGTGDVWSINPL